MIAMARKRPVFITEWFITWTNDAVIPSGMSNIATNRMYPSCAILESANIFFISCCLIAYAVETRIPKSDKYMINSEKW